MTIGHVLINTIYIPYFYSTLLSGVSWQDHAPDQSILPSKKHCPGTPPFSNYFSILTGYFGISASYHRLFASGGHAIVYNVSARSAPG
jgi:hypothetical protein